MGTAPKYAVRGPFFCPFAWQGADAWGIIAQWKHTSRSPLRAEWRGRVENIICASRWILD